MKTRIIKVIILIFLFSLTQIGFTNAYFFDKETSIGNTMTAGCWSPPSKPTLIYPSNGYVANAGSDWLANPYMDWNDSWVCPDKTVSYQYESYHDSGLTNLAYRSNPLLTNSTIPAPGTPDGNYYWHVRAFDGEKWSEWSDTWLLTVNRAALATPLLISPGNNTSFNSSSLIQTWKQVTSNLGGEVFYDYESYSDPDLANPRYTATYSNSGNGNGLIITKHAEGAQNGHVYWRVKARDENGNSSSWSEVWHFLIDNGLPNSSPDGSFSPSSSVVLNEILPDSLGDDNVAKPDGEWIELYNKSDFSVSVAGWYLTDNDINSVLITGTITNTSGTDIAGHGFLVIYTGTSPLTLDDEGDTVNLYSGPIDNSANLVDSYSYGVTPEGKSIARYPDGGDTWYDPIPTPGEINKLELEQTDNQVEDEKVEESTQEISDEPEIVLEDEIISEGEVTTEPQVEESKLETLPEVIVEEPETEVEENINEQNEIEPESTVQESALPEEIINE